MFHTQRHTTPPSLNAQAYFPNSADSHNTHLSFYTSTRNSPESVLTDISTPPREDSPNLLTLRQQGPPLLPKIRCQDQTTEPSAGPVRHHRAASAAAAAASYHFAPYSHGIQKSMVKRVRTRSPEGLKMNSPASASLSHSSYAPGSAISSSISPASAYTSATSLSTNGNFPSAFTPSSNLAVQSYADSGDFKFSNGLTSPITFNSHSTDASRRSSLAHVRTASLPAAPHRGHSRSASASSVDEATIWRHGYPTQYRHIPQYVTAAPPMNAPTAMTAPPMQPSLSGGSNYMMQPETTPALEDDFNLNTFNQDMNAFAPEHSPFAPEPSVVSQETTSILSYLSTSSPSPPLISRSVYIHSQKKNRDWYWWDVRTLRSWSDFNMNTIMSVPDFQQTLHYPIYSAPLPYPSRTCSAPDTEHNLRAIYRDFFVAKVNAALKITSGESPLFMQAINSASTNPYPKADFISNCTSDYMVTQHNDTRGRLVGVVLPYQGWNSAMRSGDPTKQVAYLQGLSHIHRVMREHRCRYGFIITEIELVCVRIAAKDDEYKPSSNPNVPDEGPIPWFGFLETAPAINLSTHGADPHTNAPRMTVALALWYMHMLVKDEALPGEPGWKIDVGGPAVRTRQHCHERDPWMPKITQSETRPAKNCRGWVFPREPFHKKENAKQNRRR